MSKEFKNDAYLVACIQKGGLDRENALKYCYKTYFKFQRQMFGAFSKKLSSEDIEEAFHDAIVAFRDQIIHQKFGGNSKLETFFYSIFKFKCIDTLRKISKDPDKLDQPFDPVNPLDDTLTSLIREEDKAILLAALDRLKELCKKVLLLWNDGYSMEEIARQTRLKNANTAKAKKSQCFNELKSMF
ncbi:MAG: sigma-70 family RNA polymerase sigma factor [Microscillaceae bacterium]|nr:sigma-70 family RNA polymerase sigma factor [Microscillaceae bacterium]